MELSEFNYHSSKEDIALYPLPERDSSRLFVIHRNTSSFEHRTFRDIADYFNPGDVLVLNDTKVFPARLFGTKPLGGRVEIMLLKEHCKNTWEALVKGVREGKVILNGDIIAWVSRPGGTNVKVTFEHRKGMISLSPLATKGREGFDIKDILHKIGTIPLPPYIKRTAEASDSVQYQTVYANNEGAVAAPTAGLHFTERLLKKIRDRGVLIETVTLHVGYGTFKPVTVHNIVDHEMDEEWYEIPETASNAIKHAKSEGRKVIAVGTTVTRALESAAIDKKRRSRFKGENDSPSPILITPGCGKTSIFIYPGFQFNVIDALVTNFHLPKSTPMILASAFTGLDLLKKSYAEARRKGYRFFSYGDAMLII